MPVGGGRVSMLTLFDDLEIETPEPSAPDLSDLDRYAFLYTATAAGNNSGVRFAMTVEDAQAWCESELSQGILHGTPWAYFWTRVPTYLRNRCDFTGAHGDTPPEIQASRIVDNGSWDDRIAGLGLTMIKASQFREWLEPYGVKVT